MDPSFSACQYSLSSWSHHRIFLFLSLLLPSFTVIGSVSCWSDSIFACFSIDIKGYLSIITSTRHYQTSPRRGSAHGNMEAFLREMREVCFFICFKTFYHAMNDFCLSASSCTSPSSTYLTAHSSHRFTSSIYHHRFFDIQCYIRFLSNRFETPCERGSGWWWCLDINQGRLRNGGLVPLGIWEDLKGDSYGGPEVTIVIIVKGWFGDILLLQRIVGCYSRQTFMEGWFHFVSNQSISWRYIIVARYGCMMR